MFFINIYKIKFYNKNLYYVILNKYVIRIICIKKLSVFLQKFILYKYKIVHDI